MIRHEKLGPVTLYIVAGNFQEYENYVEKKLKEMDSPFAPEVQFKYVASVDTIRGLSKIHGSYIGTYKSRPDIEDIKNAIAAIKAGRVAGPNNFVPATTASKVTFGAVGAPVTNGVTNSSYVGVPTQDVLTTMIKAVQELKNKIDNTNAELERLKNERV